MDTATTRILHWIFGEGATLAFVCLFIGGGIAMGLAPQKRNIKLAHLFFGVGWLWLFGGLIEGVSEMVKVRSILAYGLVFVIAGVIGVFALATYRWVEQNHNEAEPPAIADPQSQQGRRLNERI